MAAAASFDIIVSVMCLPSGFSFGQNRWAVRSLTITTGGRP